MKGKIAINKANIVALFTMLATTGVSLPGSNIRPPARAVRDAKDCS